MEVPEFFGTHSFKRYSQSEFTASTYCFIDYLWLPNWRHNRRLLADKKGAIFDASFCDFLEVKVFNKTRVKAVGFNCKYLITECVPINIDSIIVIFTKKKT